MVLGHDTDRPARTKQNKRRKLKLEILESRKLLAAAIPNPFGVPSGIELTSTSQLSQVELSEQPMLNRREILAGVKAIDDGREPGLDSNEIDTLIPDYDSARLEFGPGIMQPFEPLPPVIQPPDVTPLITVPLEQRSPILKRESLSPRDLYAHSTASKPTLRPYTVDDYDETDWFFEGESLKEFFPDITAWDNTSFDNYQPPTMYGDVLAGSISVIEQIPEEGKTVQYDLDWAYMTDYDESDGHWMYWEELDVDYTITTQWYAAFDPPGLPTPDLMLGYGVPDPNGHFAQYIEDNGIQNGPEDALVRQRVLTQYGNFYMGFEVNGTGNDVYSVVLDERYHDNFDDWYFESQTPDTLPGESVYESYAYLATMRGRDQHDVTTMTNVEPVGWDDTAALPYGQPIGNASSMKDRIAAQLPHRDTLPVANQRYSFPTLKQWHQDQGFDLNLPITEDPDPFGYGYDYYDYGDYGYGYSGPEGYGYGYSGPGGYGSYGYGYYGYQPETVHISRSSNATYSGEFDALTYTQWSILVQANPHYLDMDQYSHLHEEMSYRKSDDLVEQYESIAWAMNPPSSNLVMSDSSGSHRWRYEADTSGAHEHSDAILFPTYSDSVAVEWQWSENAIAWGDIADRTTHTRVGTAIEVMDYQVGHDEVSYTPRTDQMLEYNRHTVRPDGVLEPSSFERTYQNFDRVLTDGPDFVWEEVPTTASYSLTVFKEDQRRETTSGYLIDEITHEQKSGSVESDHWMTLEHEFKLDSANVEFNPTQHDKDYLINLHLGAEGYLPDFPNTNGFWRHQNDHWEEQLEDHVSYEFTQIESDHGDEFNGVQKESHLNVEGTANGDWYSDGEGYYTYVRYKTSDVVNRPGIAIGMVGDFYGNGWRDIANAHLGCWVGNTQFGTCATDGVIRDPEQPVVGFGEWFDDDRHARSTGYQHAFRTMIDVDRNAANQIVRKVGETELFPVEILVEDPFDPYTYTMPMQWGRRDQALWRVSGHNWDEFLASNPDVGWRSSGMVADKDNILILANGAVHSREQWDADGTSNRELNEKGQTTNVHYDSSISWSTQGTVRSFSTFESARDFDHIYFDSLSATYYPDNTFDSVATYIDNGGGREMHHFQWRITDLDIVDTGFQFYNSVLRFHPSLTVTSNEYGMYPDPQGHFEYEDLYWWYRIVNETETGGGNPLQLRFYTELYMPGLRSGRERLLAWELDVLPLNLIFE